MHTESIEEAGHFLRAKAAATPPAMRPTAVAVMPIPITPSAIRNNTTLHQNHCSDCVKNDSEPLSITLCDLVFNGFL